MESMADLERREGTRLVAELPDAGPWHFRYVQGVGVVALSKQSGAWLIDEKAGRLVKIELGQAEV